MFSWVSTPAPHVSRAHNVSQLSKNDSVILGEQVTCTFLWISMERLRLRGSLKLEVSFAEYRLFYRALLKKRPNILRSLLIVATPYRDRSLVTKQAPPLLKNIVSFIGLFVERDLQLNVESY